MRVLLIRTGSLEFLLKVLIMKECFDCSICASEYLQREEMDMVNAVDSVTTLIQHYRVIQVLYISGSGSPLNDPFYRKGACEIIMHFQTVQLQV